MLFSAQTFANPMFGSRETGSSSCCQGADLYVFHTTTSYFFWIATGSETTKEYIGSAPSAGQCNPQCGSSQISVVGPM